MNSQQKVLFHELPPVWAADSQILILGSFPSVKSRSEGFFYAHPQNRFWKVLAAVFHEQVPLSIEDKKTMLLRNKVAVWDVVGSCEITGSDDNSIRNVKANDIRSLLANSSVQSVFTNGNKAKQLYDKLIYKQQTELPAILLPSTSPANATYSLERLVSVWSEKLGSANIH